MSAVVALSQFPRSSKTEGKQSVALNKKQLREQPSTDDDGGSFLPYMEQFADVVLMT